MYKFKTLYVNMSYSTASFIFNKFKIENKLETVGKTIVFWVL